MLPRTEDHQPERLDPRVKRTRQLVLEAFTALMRERNFETISVSEIAARATVNRATVYAHYPDKYAILEGALAVEFQATLERHLLTPLPRTEASLRPLLIGLCGFVSEHNGPCDATNRQFGPLVEREIKAKLTAVLEPWVDTQGLVQPRTAHPLVATMAGAAVYAAANHWGQSQPREPVGIFVDRLLPLIRPLLGFRAPAAPA